MIRRTTRFPESRHTPSAVRAANTMLRVERKRLAKSLSVEALLDDARRITGLNDFGPDDFREPLSMLIESIHREADLHPLGYLITRSRLLGVLKNRLRAQYWFNRCPEILQQEVDPPFVITGLQRTGTTLLQRLLASDPEVRSVSSWEGLNPAPPIPRSGTIGTTVFEPNGKDHRLRAAQRAEKALKFLAPEFFVIHPVEHDGPEEEVLLLDNSFVSTVPEALMYVPSFSSWLEEQDQSPAYRRLVDLLKLLQWQERRQYWVLKSPHHLEWPDYLVSHLPNAKIIMTHRDPVVATNSFFSMVWHSNRLLSESTTAEQLARHWLQKTRRMVNRFIAHRGPNGSIGTNPVVDVSYYDLVADPIATVREIYEEFGLELTAEKEARMSKVLKNHKRDKYGIHKYHLESFGISREESGEAFADYRDRYDVPREQDR